jgi:hypothetical protein
LRDGSRPAAVYEDIIDDRRQLCRTSSKPAEF